VVLHGAAGIEQTERGATTDEYFKPPLATGTSPAAFEPFDRHVDRACAVSIRASVNNAASRATTINCLRI